MRKTLFILATLLAGCASQHDPYESMSGPGEFDRTFITHAAENGAAEIQLGQLAQERGEDYNVRKLGRQTVADHTRLSAQLTQLARMKGIPLPDGPGQEGQTAIADLTNRAAADFDKTFVKTTIEAHVKSVAEFTEAAEKAQDKDIRRFASQSLPTLQDHLRIAKDLKQK